MSHFLPITLDEVKRLGWECVDVVLVTGDAYIDHPAFGTAVIGRTLEAAGYRVAVNAQCPCRLGLCVVARVLHFGSRRFHAAPPFS